MIYLLTTIHVLVCLFLVVVVLLQSGKAADLAGAFGGMGSQTAFGPRGTATLLSKWTTIAAGLFMVTSLSLALLQTRYSGATGSVVDRVKAPVTNNTPAAPAPAPAKSAPGQTPTPAGGVTLPSSALPSVTPSENGAKVEFPTNSAAPAQAPAKAPESAPPVKK